MVYQPAFSNQSLTSKKKTKNKKTKKKTSCLCIPFNGVGFP